MVSSIGKVVLSGKMQVERQDTSFCTPRLWHSWKMLSFMFTLSLQNCTLYFMLAKRPPTLAARWMTWVGWYLSKMAATAAGSQRLPSCEEKRDGGQRESFAFSGAATRRKGWGRARTRRSPAR